MVLSFSEYQLDTRRFELRHRNVPQSVEPKVILLISYLARNADRVVSKDELLTHIWDGRFVMESVITRTVSLARRALGTSSCIKNQYGRGYRFTLPVSVEDDSAVSMVSRFGCCSASPMPADFGYSHCLPAPRWSLSTALSLSH